MLIILFFILGAIFGSFVSMASHRLITEEDMIKKSSYCPACKHKLSALDLVPIFSWLCLKGKCRHCKVHISSRYPLIELSLAAVFALTYSVYGLTAIGFALLATAVALMVLIVTDFEEYYIPDGILIILAFIGVIYAYYAGILSFLTPIKSLSLYLFAYLTKYLFIKIRKKDGLGYGDVKFMLIIGIYLPFMAIPLFLILSGLTGIAIGLYWKYVKKNEYYPFGPALATSMYILLLFPDFVDIMFLFNN